VMLVYFMSKGIISFYQTGVVLSTPPIEHSEEYSRRCSIDPLPFHLRKNKELLCASSNQYVVHVGLVIEGEMLTRFIENLLEIGNFYCSTNAVHFETFTLSQMDYFEDHNLFPPHIDGWLLMGDHFELSRWDRIENRYGRIGLGSENCNNGWPSLSQINPPRFGLLTYGDCAIVDNVDFFVMPLGPLFEGARDFPFFQPNVIPIDERSIDLFGRFTITPQKPTRQVCLLTAQQHCFSNELTCKLGTDWTYFLPSILKDGNANFRQMENSRFVLCPSGYNFEQYRIWEAILAGAIPVIEDIPSGNFTSPAYGAEFLCRPSDIHYLLKETRAPVLFIQDWRDLPHLLARIRGKEQQLQDALVKWREPFFVHFKILLVELILKHFKK